MQYTGVLWWQFRPTESRWYGYNNAGTSPSVVKWWYCNGIPYAGCDNVPSHLYGLLRGSGWGFLGTTFELNWNGTSFVGSKLICGGTSLLTISTTDVGVGQQIDCDVRVDGIGGTLATFVTDCAHFATGNSGNNGTYGGCIGSMLNSRIALSETPIL